MKLFSKTTAAAMAAVLFSVAQPASAQVEVVELDVPSTRMGDTEGGTTKGGTKSGTSRQVRESYSARAVKPDPASLTEFYFQLQTLQQELQTLRGIVEEQSHELKKLKQQRLDDYLDLDRRVSQLSKGQAAAPSLSQPSNNARATRGTPLLPVEPSSDSSVKLPDELSTYRAGIDAVLKQRDYDKGIASFNTYLEHYPQGLYAPNAKYWLGQVYMQRSDLANSYQWFQDLVKNHPNHQKTPEAQFKLGKVLHMQGELASAKIQLESVVSSGSSVARLAQDYLDKHF